jgi:hypothetical protein
MFSVIARNDNTSSRTLVADFQFEVDAQNFIREAEQIKLDAFIFFELAQD